MVKNTHGGNKSKSMARKNIDGGGGGGGGGYAPLRLPSCEFEKIAFVEKLLGNGMFYAITNDGLKLLCRIRNKFKGRSRRGNDVTIGKLVLIGLRQWEIPHFKEADLLLVYDDSHIDTLRISNIDLSLFYYQHDNHLIFEGDGGDDCPPLAPLEAGSDKKTNDFINEEFIDDI